MPSRPCRRDSRYQGPVNGVNMPVLDGDQAKRFLLSFVLRIPNQSDAGEEKDDADDTYHDERSVRIVILHKLDTCVNKANNSQDG